MKMLRWIRGNMSNDRIKNDGFLRS